MQYQIISFHQGNPRFKTGEVAFRVTSSETNGAETFADAIYFAKGTLEVEQETIIATRNILVQENVTDNNTYNINQVLLEN